MLTRFQGSNGGRLLNEALLRQCIVNGNVEIAARLATVAEVLGYKTGEVLIDQEGADNHLNLIIVGRFGIKINGRDMAVRIAGQHVGEMALIDPGAKRSATVVALEESVVARISEPHFSALAQEYPRLWRSLACELGERLRQRSLSVRSRNELARLFVGSSRESLSIANEIQAGLAQDQVIVTVWANGIFGASELSLESLECAAAYADFAVLVFSPDDQVISRDKQADAPRDNVVFELGLFMGALGRHRVFVVLPEGSKLKMPTDLLGITSLKYKSGESRDLPARLGSVCTELRKIIAKLGTR